jgi:hypothetical protein
MNNTDNGWFLIIAALAFLAFSPLDASGGIFVAVIGAGACAVAAFVLFWKGDTV